MCGRALAVRAPEWQQLDGHHNCACGGAAAAAADEHIRSAAGEALS